MQFWGHSFENKEHKGPYESYELTPKKRSNYFQADFFNEVTRGNIYVCLNSFVYFLRHDKIVLLWPKMGEKYKKRVKNTLWEFVEMRLKKSH